MKFTKTEKSWILYDVANSAFTLITSATIPLWFAYLYSLEPVGDIPHTTFFALTTSVSVAIIALISPALGSIADHKGMKMKLFVGSVAIGVLGGFAFTAVNQWIAFLILYILSRTGYSLSNVFYDSMLVDVTSDERMDMISSYGYAWGYVGSTIPFIVGLVFVLMPDLFGLDTAMGMKISFVITFIWWLVLTYPLVKDVKQTYYQESEKHLVAKSIKAMVKTFNKIRANKIMFYYIIGYFFFIDGVYTIISMASSFGAEVGLETSGMILALLFTQFIAFPFAILAGKLATKYKVLSLLKVYILIYAGVAVFGFFLKSQWQFWVLAAVVGIAQGGVQSLSRSFFGKLVPKENSNEYFGFFNIFGKYADLLGPILMAISGIVFKQSKYAILFLVVFFVIGYVLMDKVDKLMEQKVS